MCRFIKYVHIWIRRSPPVSDAEIGAIGETSARPLESLRIPRGVPRFRVEAHEMARPGRIERGRLGARPPAASLLHDDSPEGEWVRRQQGKSTRAIVRFLDQFRKAVGVASRCGRPRR